VKKFSDWAALNEIAAVEPQDAGMPAQQAPEPQQMPGRIRSASGARQADTNTAKELGNPVAGAISEISQGMLLLASRDPNLFKALVGKLRQYLRRAGVEGVKTAGYLGQDTNRVMTAINNKEQGES
jgi:hypothetical protein